MRLSVVDQANGRVVGTVELFALLAPLSREGGLLTNAAPYAVDRIAAVKRAGFALSPDSLIGWDGRVYGDYWTLR